MELGVHLRSRLLSAGVQLEPTFKIRSRMCAVLQHRSPTLPVIPSKPAGPGAAPQYIHRSGGGHCKREVLAVFLKP